MPVFITAFGAPWRPILFEEMRKEMQGLQYPSFTHFFKSNEAIHLRNGVISLSDEELLAVFKTSFPHLYSLEY